jgi:hypothetical protein
MDRITLDILDAPQLFVEDTPIQAQRGLRRRVHQMTKVSESPVLRADQPWEAPRFDPERVVYDEAEGRWKMWYNHVGARPQPPAGHTGTSLCLAYSADGVRWEKPALGAFAAEVPNNICVDEDGRPLRNGLIFHEPRDPDTDKRYKAIVYKPSYYLYYSADGIRFRAYSSNPVWPNGAGDGLEETRFMTWDERVRKYRGYMRVWQRHQTIRKTSLGESNDLRSWTGPRITWEAGPEFGPGAQIYGMNVVIEGGYYWAFPWMFYIDEAFDPDVQQSMRFKLAWSTDGVNWTALAPEQDFVPMGRRSPPCPATGTSKWPSPSACSAPPLPRPVRAGR